MTQGKFHFQPPVKDKLEAAFLKFHRENPHVMDRLAEMAFDVLAAGYTRWSISSLFERLRWEERIESRNSEFRLNNDHRSFAARYLEARHPELRGLFEKRRSVADRRYGK